MNREWGTPYPRDGKSGQDRVRIEPSVRYLAAETVARDALEKIPKAVMDRISGQLSWMPLASWLEKQAAERPPITQLCGSPLFMQMLEHGVKFGGNVMRYSDWSIARALPALEEFGTLCRTLHYELIEACTAANTAQEAPAE